ncbi:hypothetical protein MHBO_001034 [Bonamia ostreae]|uniref:Secreted protein n=1 Tax=Bonamia ostreae TaxID=126728 RepID=A0ABV2AIA7_9EUKA
MEFVLFFVWLRLCFDLAKNLGHLDCPDFHVEGYKPLYYQHDETEDRYLCAVICDEEKGYFPSGHNLHNFLICSFSQLK